MRLRIRRAARHHVRPTSSRAAALAAAAVTSAAASGAVVYESGTLGPTGQRSGYLVDYQTYFGARFELTDSVTVDRVGGHFFESQPSNPPSVAASALPPSSTIFGAIVDLSGPTDVPDSTDLSTGDVRATAVIHCPYGSSDVYGKFEPVTLGPGWYAVVFGGGNFGSTGAAGAAFNNPQVGTPSYFRNFGGGAWQNVGDTGVRFVVADPTAKFWQTGQGTGSWNDYSSWGPGGAPVMSDDTNFYLGDAYTVTFPTDAVANDIIVNNRPTFALGGKTLTNGGRLIVQSDGAGSTAALKIQNGYLDRVVGHELVVADSLAGSLEFSNNAFLSSTSNGLIVGRNGAGQMTVADSILYTAWAGVADDPASLPNTPGGGSGNVTLNFGAVWFVSGDFHLGRNGPAGIIINSGASLDVDGAFTIFNTSSEVSLRGGYLEVGSLFNNGGAFGWSGGHLRITASNLNFATGGPFGPFLTMIAGRTLTCDANATIASGAQLSVGGGTVTVNGASVTNNGSLQVTSGTVSVHALEYTAPGTGSVYVADGTLTADRIRQNTLTLTGSALVKLRPSGGGVANVSRAASLGFADSAKLDLSDNKLITATALGSWDGTSYTGVSGLVDAGRGNASNAQWNGAGIVTSDARAINTGDLCSIGVAQVSDFKNIADTETTTFAGQTVLGSDVVAMFTWGGDANLDGKINIDDYGRIDGNVAQSGSLFGWFNGDFNYDGKINIDDYGIIDGNINRQEGPFPITQDITGAIAAVPEPTALAAVCAASLLLRRRRS